MAESRSEELFQTLAAPWLARPGVTRSTMMGFPCLRAEGQFFMAVHRDGKSLLVKVASERVSSLVAAKLGEEFAPNGRVFREWLAVPERLADTWSARIEEAYAFVRGAR